MESVITLPRLPALSSSLPCHFDLSLLWPRWWSELHVFYSFSIGSEMQNHSSQGCALAGSMMILSPSPFWLSLSSSPMCWEWPGSACLVSLQCPCLCSTTYGQLVKSSSHPRPTGQPVWSRSAWISDNTVLPFNPPITVSALVRTAGPQLLRGHLVIVVLACIHSSSAMVCTLSLNRLHF